MAYKHWLKSDFNLKVILTEQTTYKKQLTSAASSYSLGQHLCSCEKKKIKC